MALLTTAITKPTQKSIKALIYGSPGSGKTSFGASATKSILIDCENGAGAIATPRTPYLQRWPEIEAWLRELETAQHDYHVVVIDTIDWMMRRAEEHVAGTNEKNIAATLGRSHGGYGNGKQVLRNLAYQSVLPLLDRIVNRGVAVLMLAHVSRHSVIDLDGIEVEKSAPDLPPDYINTFVEWSDMVGAIRVNGDNRALITRETPKVLAKNRYNLPPEIPLTWADFVGAVTGKK